MKHFTIREANRRDLPHIAALWQEMMTFHRQYDARFVFSPDAQKLVERHLLETIRSRGARLLVAEFDEGMWNSGVSEVQIVGYILGEVHTRRPIYPVGNYGFISDLSVTEKWRRAGVGRALVAALMAWFDGQKITAVELFAAEANPVSLAFWHALGFTDYLRLLQRTTETGLITNKEAGEQQP
jgi:ribosomal protein S18 acetylase RimI-like enzyme